MTTARELADHLAQLLRRERGAMADFLLALADFDKKRGWADLGYPSLFAFLRKELTLSAGAAQYRKTAAELIQRHPEVEAALRAGQLCLSSVCEVAKVITRENAAEILPRFYGLSARDAAFVSASIRPVADPPTRTVVTGFRQAPVPVASPSETPRTEAKPDLLRTSEPPLDPPPAPPALAARPVPPERPSTVQPLDAARGRLHLNVTREFLAKLEAATDALSHSHPDATPEEILEAGLDLILTQQQKRRGLVHKPRKTPAPSSTDHLPADVRREVWRRSGGRCEFLLESGLRCDSTWQVEIDHIHPRALGGASTVENTRAACRPHNLEAARRVFGDEKMDRFTRKRRASG